MAFYVNYNIFDEINQNLHGLDIIKTSFDNRKNC